MPAKGDAGVLQQLCERHDLPAPGRAGERMRVHPIALDGPGHRLENVLKLRHVFREIQARLADVGPKSDRLHYS